MFKWLCKIINAYRTVFYFVYGGIKFKKPYKLILIPFKAVLAVIALVLMFTGEVYALMTAILLLCTVTIIPLVLMIIFIGDFFSTMIAIYMTIWIYLASGAFILSFILFLPVWLSIPFNVVYFVIYLISYIFYKCILACGSVCKWFCTNCCCECTNCVDEDVSPRSNNDLNPMDEIEIVIDDADKNKIPAKNKKVVIFDKIYETKDLPPINSSTIIFESTLDDRHV